MPNVRSKINVSKKKILQPNPQNHKNHATAFLKLHKPQKLFNSVKLKNGNSLSVEYWT